MNEELEQKAAQALSEILDLALKTKDFVVEQAPDVVRQLLAWSFVQSLVPYLLWLAVSALAFSISAYLWKRRPFPDYHSTLEEDETGSNPRDLEWLNRAISLIVAAVALLADLIALSEAEWIWLKILVAPKLFLLEYAATLVK